MKARSFLIFIALTLAACGGSDQASRPEPPQSVPTQQPTVAENQSERLANWFADKFEEELQASPSWLTYLGRKDKYDQFEELTEAELEKHLAWSAATVKELTSTFPYDSLEPEEKTSYDLWIYGYESELAGHQFIRNQYIFTQFLGEQSGLPEFLINLHRVDDESDMDAYISRIRGIARAIGELLDRAKLNASEGTRPPRFAYQGVIKEASTIISGAPFNEGQNESPLWADASGKIAALKGNGIITDEKAEILREQTRAALLTQLGPAYETLIAWFTSDLENSDAEPQGAASLPNGKAFYNHRLKRSTTTDLTAEEIHQIGLREVERLAGEMQAEARRAGFEGPLKNYIKLLKNDDRQFYPNTNEGRQQYLADTENYLAHMGSLLPDYFGILPKAGLVVKRVEPFREQDGAAQFYSAGTPDGSRPGVYYVHLSDTRTMPRYNMEAVAYHEGNPGHHMQVAISQELTSIPLFRTQSGYTAYSEGWALYAERLAGEMGAYQSDHAEFGRLSNEMWRAVRLVVDTGLHSKGWTEEQAIDYFMEWTPLPYETAKSEVRRYLVWPGQATAYMIGMLKILELREFAQRNLGEKFDIRQFHDTILAGGSLPLSILEKRVTDWVSATRIAP